MSEAKEEKEPSSEPQEGPNEPRPAQPETWGEPGATYGIDGVQWPPKKPAEPGGDR